MGRTSKRLLAILLAGVLLLAALALAACEDKRVNIDHIEIYSSPKTEYYIGESLDLTDAKILVAYKNNTDELVDITPSMISDYDPNTLGVQYIKVYYNGHSATVRVNVKRYAVVSVELVIPGENFDYIVEQNLRTNDSYLVLHYANSTEDRIPITPAMCSGYDPNVIGQQTITVSYEQDGNVYSGTYNVNVEDKELIGVEVTMKPTQNVYYIGDDTLDLRGGELFLKYNNGYSERLPMADEEGVLDGLKVVWDNTVVDSDSVVTVTYRGFTAKFTIDVQNRNVESYEIVGEIPTQMQNLPLDLEGVDIMINYTNGETETVPMSGDRVEVRGYDNSAPGTQELVLAFLYGGVELEFKSSVTVTVEARKAVGLEIAEPAPVIYQDTEFDITDWKYRLVYNNGERGEETSLTPTLVKWENNVQITSYPVPGTQQWYIHYDDGVELTYSFTVVALEVVDIVFHGAENVIAYYGGEAEVDDVRMSVTYNSGNVVDDVPLDADAVVFDNTKMGNQLATVVYTDKYEEGFETPLYVTVIKKIVSVEIGGDYKTDYHINEEFDATGMVLYVTYESNGGTEADMVSESDEDFYDNWSFMSEEEGGSLTFVTVGEQNIRLINAGLSCDVTFKVNVSNDFISLIGLYRENDGAYVPVSSGISTMTVVQGNNIDLDGYYILVEFEGDSRYIPVTADMTDYNPRNTALGDRKVVVAFGDGEGNVYGECEFVVTVVGKSALGIEIAVLPDKLVYVAGNFSEALDLTGIVVRLVYDNGTYEVVDNSSLTYSGFENTEEGEQTITVNYFGDTIHTATFTIDVLGAKPSSISWVSDTIPAADLTQGSVFDFDTVYVPNDSGSYITSLSLRNVVIKYDNGDSDIVTLGEIREAFTVTDYNPTSAGKQYVTLNYVNGTFLKVEVNVLVRTLASIELINSAGTNDFRVIQGAPIDLTDLKLVLTFDDGAESVIPVEANYLNYDAALNPGGYNANDTTTGMRSVTVRYLYGSEAEAKTCTVTFNVLEKNLVSVEIYDIPKQKYIENEAFDQSVGSVILYYDNGESEIRYLSTASVNIPTSSFNIDISNFDNSEFSGLVSKTQRITVTCEYNGIRKSTGFNIYMRDRRSAEVRFDADNAYSVTYGTPSDIKLALYGYASYDSESADVAFDPSVYKVEYIPESIWTTVVREDGVDYTVVPIYAGTYRIVVTYAGNTVHNAFLDDSRTLTIDKKAIYLGFVPGSMVYGADVPDILVIFREQGGVVADDPFEAFAYEDDFESDAFNSEAGTYMTVYLADKDGNRYTYADGRHVALTMFDVIYTDSYGATITVSERSNAGRYTIRYNTPIVSANYEITYDVAEFNITQRRIVVNPQDTSFTYGFQPPVIPYTTSPVDGVADSGICNGDILIGALSRENSTDNSVGTYLITLGTLQGLNPNYLFEMKGAAYVTIKARDIYVKVDSSVKVYGEEFNTPAFRFYGDAACEDESNAFAAGDNAQSIGEFVLDGAIDKYTAAGQYTIGAKLVEGTEGVSYNNYKVHVVKGTVEITRRPVQITAEAAFKYYGDPDPVIRYTASAISGNPASGLVTDPEGVADTLEGSLSRISGEDCGEYNVTAGTLAEEADYEIILVSQKFTVKPKELIPVFTEAELTKVYDGKAPSLTAAVVYYKTADGSLAQADDDELGVFNGVLAYTFTNASKNAGTYAVSVSSKNINYSAYFEEGASYSYTIAKRKFSVTRADYSDLPDGMEYKGSAYTITAEVSSEYLQPVYNADGITQATDENNNPLFDEVTLVLSIMNVTDAGTYTVSVTNVLNQNYEIDGNEVVEFTVLPKKVYIEILCDSEEFPDTLEYEFNNQAAYIMATDYVLKDSAGGSLGLSEVPQFSLGITLNGVEVVARDVRYDDNGEIADYDISVVSTAVNDNYGFEMLRDYKFRIVPKAVSVTVYDRYLQKTYDGNAPAIGAGMFSLSQTGIDQNSISFSFEREENDGRDNTSVGNYSVSVTCLDRNYTVSLYASYVYTINVANISVSLQASALSKIYDGNGYSFTYSNLNLGSYVGSAPVIRNFSIPDVPFADGRKNAYEQFLIDFAALSAALDELTSNYSSVDFNETASARTYLQKTADSAESFNSAISAYSYILQQNSYDSMRAATATIITEITAAYNSLVQSETDNARTHYSNCAAHISQLVTVFAGESSYIAFVFTGDGNGLTVNAGTYTYEVFANDFNRQFNMLGDSRTVTVNSRTLQIFVDNVTISYGTTIGSIPFRIKDPRSGEFIESGLNVKGVPASDGMLPGAKVGSYTITTEGMYIALEGSSEADPNYNLTVGQLGSFIVDRAKISVLLDDVSGGNFVYGTQIRKSGLPGGYSYINIDNVTEDSDLGKLALQNGKGDTFEEKKLDYFGKLQGGDTADIIISDYVIFYCYINGVSGTEIFDTTEAPAGQYILTAEGFTTTGNNYTVQVIPSTLTIAKAVLNVSVGTSGNIEKIYGEEGVTFNYQGFQNNDYAGNVYVIGEDGSATTLSNMKWDYRLVTEGADDPMSAATVVTGTPVAIRLLEGENILENYTMNFNVDINILVTKATLTLNVRAESGSITGITAPYRGVPTPGSYYYTYEGLKNGETAESLGIDIDGQYAPVLYTKNGNAYYTAGTHYFGMDNMDVSAATAKLANYKLTVAQFSYTVTPLSIKVTLDTTGFATLRYYDESLKDRIYKLSPYISEIHYSVETVTSSSGSETKIEIPSSVSIISGQYGTSEFRIEIDYPENGNVEQLSEKEFDELLSKIAKFSSSVGSGVIDDSNGVRHEYYRYDEMYRHSLTLGDVDAATNTAICSLSGMSVSDINFKFEYAPFSVTVYDSLAQLLVSMEEKLLDTDLSLTDEEIYELIRVVALDNELNDIFNGTGNANSEGVSVISGQIPDVTGVTEILRLAYELSYKLGDKITDSEYLTYRYINASGQEVSIEATDERTLTYNSDSVYGDVPIRFYDTSTVTYADEDLALKKDGATDYAIGSLDLSVNGTSYLASDKHNFDRGTIQFRVLPAGVAQNSVVRIVLNGDYATDKYLYIEFAYGDYNKLTVGYSGGYEYVYELAYGSVFDGKSHEVKFRLDTEYLTLVIAVDGKVGAIYDLRSLSLPGNAQALAYGERGTLSSDSDYGAYVVASAFAIRRIECYAQGLYDKSGTFISLKENSDAVIITTNLNDYFTTTVQLASFFGLPAQLPAGYEALFFVNGGSTTYAWGDSVPLVRGRHKVELALYYTNESGTKYLVDYDMLIVTIDKAKQSGTVVLNKEDGSEPVIYSDGSVFDLYTVDSNYSGNTIDKSLVRTDGTMSGQIMAVGHEDTENKYTYTVFDLVRTAVVKDGVAVYPGGTGRIDYYLLSNGAEVGAGGVNIFLRFNVIQANDEVCGSGAYDYTVTVELHYEVYSKTGVVYLDNLKYTGNENPPTFAVNAYRDRNISSYGTNNYAVAVTRVGAGTETYVFADEKGDMDAFILNGFYAVNAPRMVFHTLSLEERLPEAARDYLVINGSESKWVANRESGVEIAQGSTVTVNDGFDLPKAHAGDTQTWVYASAANSGEIKFRFNESVWETSEVIDEIADRGAYLRFDIATNTFYFGFHYGSVYSFEQAWTPQTAWSAGNKHKLTLALNTDFDRYPPKHTTAEVFHDGVALTASGGDNIYYQEITVTYDGETHVFYLPQFGDMGLWKQADGSVYGTENKYSVITDINTTPTFLALYRYSRLETGVDITLYGVSGSYGADNGLTDGYVTEQPKI